MENRNFCDGAIVKHGCFSKPSVVQLIRFLIVEPANSGSSPQLDRVLIFSWTIPVFNQHYSFSGRRRVVDSEMPILISSILRINRLSLLEVLLEVLENTPMKRPISEIPEQEYMASSSPILLV